MPQGISFAELQTLINFIYRGEVDVPRENLDSLLKAATQLQIQGLCSGFDGRNGDFADDSAADGEVENYALSSQLLLAGNRKKRKSSSPKHRNPSAKSKRKSLKPTRYEETDESNDKEDDGASSSNPTDDNVMPVDFTVRRKEKRRQDHSKSASAGNGDCRDGGRGQSPHIDVVSTDEQKENENALESSAWSLYHRNLILNGDLNAAGSSAAAAAAALNLSQDVNPSSSATATDTSFFGQLNVAAAAAAAAAAMQQQSPAFPTMLVPNPCAPAFPQAAQSQILQVPSADRSETNKTTSSPPKLEERSPSSSSSSASTTGYSKKDMSKALDAIKTKRMSVTQASELYGISTSTLWQRASKLGISSPRKDVAPGNKTWCEEDLNNALEALRKKEISANKAAKVFGIPSSTLYKIARKEKIELAQPFNAVQTTWTQEDLDHSLEAIRKGMPVQKAAAEFGIPSGTLYGRCKKVGIELSKTAAVHWSESDMKKALETVRTGGMSINQAAIHYNLPYSSLYGRINRLKRDNPADWAGFTGDLSLDAFPATNGSGGGIGPSEASTSAAAAAAAYAAGSSAFHPFSLPTLLDRDGSRRSLEDVARMEDECSDSIAAAGKSKISVAPLTRSAAASHTADRD